MSILFSNSILPYNTAALRAASRFAALLLSLGSASLIHAQGTTAAATIYDSGNPSNDEQYLLELINRARANPPAEGQRLAAIQDTDIIQEFTYFSVNTDTVRSDFATYAARPPLAMNAKLSSAAHSLSMDEGTNGFQGHVGSDASTPPSRIAAAGYSALTYGENTYAMVQGPFFCHAAFNVDWGVPDLVHRELIMGLVPALPTFREIGLASVAATAAAYGPFVVTEEFALTSATPFALGAAFKNNDGTSFYAPGEGVGNIRVSSPQSSYYTMTGAAGGYSLPLDLVGADGAVQIVFTDATGAQTVRNVTLPALPAGGPDAIVGSTLANIKVDLIMAGDPITNISVSASKMADRATGQAGQFTFVRSGGDVSQPLAVQYSLNGSAISGQDYKPAAGTVTFAAGSLQAKVKIKPISSNNPSAGKVKVVLKLIPGSGYQASQTSPAKVKLTID